MTFEQRVQLNQALVTEPWGEDAPSGRGMYMGGCGVWWGSGKRPERTAGLTTCGAVHRV